MSPTFLRSASAWACCLLLFGVVPAGGWAADAAAGEDPRIEALEAAFDTWVEAINFRCNFRLIEGQAATLEDARAGRFKQPRDTSADAIGFLAKTGDKLRARLDYGRPPTKLANDEYTHSSTEEIFNGLAFIDHQFRPAGGRGEASVAIGPRSALSNTSAVPALGLVGVQLPLNPRGSSEEVNPLRHFKAREAADSPPATRTLTEVDAEHVMVMLDQPQPDYRMRLEVVFWTVPDLPVVSRLTIFGGEPNGPERMHDTVLSNFVKVPGGMVASTARRSLVDGQKRPINVEEWTSDDMAGPALAADYVLTVPESTDVFGIYENVMGKLPISGGTRTIDGAVLEVADFYVHPMRGPLVVTGAGTIWARRLAVAGLVAVVLAGCVLLWRRRAAA